MDLKRESDFILQQTCKVRYKNFNARLNRIEGATYLIFVGLILNYLK